MIKSIKDKFKEFCHYVYDAKHDAFFPCSWPVAVVFVIWNWRTVKSYYKED